MDDYDDLEIDYYMHSEAWWDSAYRAKDDPELVGVLLPLHCPICDEPCDERDKTLHLKIQLARTPGTAFFSYAHIECFVEALHPKQQGNIFGPEREDEEF